MKSILAISFLLASSYGDTPYPECGRAFVEQGIINFCKIDRKYLNFYGDCNEANGYHPRFTVPGCGMACPGLGVTSFETYYDFVCNFKEKPSKAAIDLTCCEVTIQQLYKKDADGSGKLKSNAECAKATLDKMAEDKAQG